MIEFRLAWTVHSEIVELSVKGSLLRRVALSNSQALGKGVNVVVLRTEGTTLIVEPLDVAR